MEEEPGSSWMRRRLADLGGSSPTPPSAAPALKSVIVTTSAASSCNTRARQGLQLAALDPEATLLPVGPAANMAALASLHR